MNWQTETILANIAAFEVPLDSASWQRLVLLKQCHAVAYLSRFCLRAIDDSERVVAAAKMRVWLTSSVVWKDYFFIFLLLVSVFHTII